MKAIIAINKEGYIGLNSTLPWKSPDDLKHFKQLTLGCNLLVGYNTYIKLPKLSGRNVILDTNDVDISTIDWCIGGKKTYEKYMHLFTELHISIINDNTIGDTKSPDFSSLKCPIFYYNFETI